MALQLSKENSQGHTGNYWKITALKLEYIGEVAEVQVDLFKDSAAASANKDPMERLEYTWTTDDEGTDNWTGTFDAATLDTLNQNPQERAYVKLKTLSEFTGAVDV